MYIKDFLFCDDIRQEVGNKNSLMGIYGEDINFSGPQPGVPVVWPINKPIGLFIRVMIEEGDDFNAVQMKLGMDGYDSPFPNLTLNMDASKLDKRIVNIATRIEPLPIPGPGKLVVYLTPMKDGKPITTFSEVSIEIKTS